MPKNSSLNQPINVFYSYSHKDRALLNKLRKHLDNVRMEEQVHFIDWFDKMIGPGRSWSETINEKLEDSQIVLLLVSDNFLGSKYINEYELKIAMQLHDENKARIIPIIVGKCEWESTPFAEFQAIRGDGEVLEVSDNRDNAFRRAAVEICKSIKKQQAEIKNNVYPESAFETVPIELSDYFTGRADILEKLRHDLRMNKKQVLSGLGGVGKTQIAVKYAYKYRRWYKEIFWVQAESFEEMNEAEEMKKVKNRIAQGIVELQSRIDDPYIRSNGDLDNISKAKIIMNWMSKQERFLLIFDNVDMPAAIKEFIKNKPKCHILLTSCAQNFRQLGISEPLVIKKMPEAEALEFLKKSCRWDYKDANEEMAAKQITRKLGYLPLALEQAASYINQIQVTMEAYLSDYKARYLELLEKRWAEIGDYRDSVKTTWAMNFKKVQVRSQAAADILNFSSFLSPDQIPFYILKNGASELGPAISEALKDADKQPTLINETLSPLIDYSLIHLNHNKDIYSIHRLVQEVVKDNLSESKRTLWAARTVRAVGKAFPEHESFKGTTARISQGFAAKTLIENMGFKSIDSAYLLTELGITLFHIGRFEESWDLLKKAKKMIKSDQDQRGQYMRVYAKCLNWLGILNRRNGDLDAAEELHQQALREAIRLKDRKLEAHVNANLGAVLLWRSGFKPSEVNEYWKQSLNISKSIQDDYWTAHFGIDVGYMTFLEGNTDRDKFKKALEDLEKYTNLARDKNFPEHIARGLMNQGSVGFADGKIKQAESLYKEALSRAEQQDSSRLIWRIQHNLGNIYRKQKKYQEAEDYYGKAIADLDDMIKHMDETEKRRFIALRAGPFYSMYTLHRKFNKDKRAEEFAEQCMQKRLFNVKKIDSDDVVSEMPNFFDGFYISTE